MVTDHDVAAAAGADVVACGATEDDVRPDAGGDRVGAADRRVHRGDQAERAHRAVGEVVHAAVAGLGDHGAARVDPLHEAAVAEDDVAAGAAVQLVGADAAEDDQRQGRGVAVDDVVVGRRPPAGSRRWPAS